MSKHGRSTANPRNENKRNRIQSWLMQEGWQISELQALGALWVIVAKTATGFSIVVSQPTSVLDRTSIQASVTVSDDHQKLLAAMEPKERENLWWNLRVGLLRMGLEMTGFAEPVKILQIGQRIYDDGLTKDRFLQRVSKVKDGQVLILWMVARALNQPPDDEVLGSDLIS